MLASEENIRAVASALQTYGIEKTVVDPVRTGTCYWLFCSSTESIMFRFVSFRFIGHDLNIQPPAPSRFGYFNIRL